jgi:hypothetical protein
MLCNSRIEEKWGVEKRLKPFLFNRTQSWDLLIYVEESKYTVYVDDILVGTYEHRLNPRACDKLQIAGEVVLQGVHLK